uniref:Uncharacterized protein n=1 Tax=Aplanochytrium stocchinoi TaxID=215587 RepID=A0A6S8E242_9STRA|mmetsp:Transcript_9474/g.10791  ORF Transcript_9474/g.10791 Transcript_9474/m.10791 type:complete len:214 (-) Transcript_9474:233-874(-)|eukprot:CAMPEP_0204830628 /NCGR_PEP_ID=MMETSP1346-20131115/9020_1 /ASSEMBLY_ACC=CAM_ASM_000771 /TAXON_ID=215587 /ORGANISM="Aplanochytrium stocchinoi, Strain GSBS06" /LENGTH=213 /DNA_ID=CAMNT_0051961075 /DNA_START=507 /DNA_END=1148 /DNA_ORIENTATION=+
MMPYGARVLDNLFKKPSSESAATSKISNADKEHLELLRKYVSAKQHKKGSKAQELLSQAAQERKQRHSKRMKALQIAADKSVNPLHISNKKKKPEESEKSEENKSRLLQLLTGPQDQVSKQERSLKLPESKRKRRRAHKNSEFVDIRVVEQESFNEEYSKAVREVEGDYTQRNAWVLKIMQEADHGGTIHKSIYKGLGIDTKRKKRKHRVVKV